MALARAVLAEHDQRQKDGFADPARLARLVERVDERRVGHRPAGRLAGRGDQAPGQGVALAQRLEGGAQQGLAAAEHVVAQAFAHGAPGGQAALRGQRGAAGQSRIRPQQGRGGGGLRIDDRLLPAQHQPGARLFVAAGSVERTPRGAREPGEIRRDGNLVEQRQVHRHQGLIEPGPLAPFQGNAEELGPRRRQGLAPGGLIQQRARARALHRLGGADRAGNFLGREGKGTIDSSQRRAVEHAHAASRFRSLRPLLERRVGRLGDGHQKRRRGALGQAGGQRRPERLHHREMQRRHLRIGRNLRLRAEQRTDEREENRVVRAAPLAQQIETQHHLVDLARDHLAQHHRLLPIGDLVVGGDAAAHAATGPGGVAREQQAVDPDPGDGFVAGTARHDGEQIVDLRDLAQSHEPLEPQRQQAGLLGSRVVEGADGRRCDRGQKPAGERAHPARVHGVRKEPEQARHDPTIGTLPHLDAEAAGPGTERADRIGRDLAERVDFDVAAASGGGLCGRADAGFDDAVSRHGHTGRRRRCRRHQPQRL